MIESNENKEGDDKKKMSEKEGKQLLYNPFFFNRSRKINFLQRIRLRESD